MAMPHFGLSELPEELLELVFQYLPIKCRLSAGLTCRQWLRVLAPIYYNVTDLRVIFEDGYCIPNFNAEPLSGVKNGTYSMIITLCQCSEHTVCHCQLLWALLPIMGPYLRQIILEDYFLKPNSFVAGQTLDIFFENCESKLECLELHNVDLSSVSGATFAKIGRFRQLNQLALFQCQQRLVGDRPLLLNDRLLSALIKSQSLQQLQITHCPYVTDRLLKHVSRSCPRLWLGDFTGCKEVTARGVAHFCETLSWRKPDMLYLKIGHTDVKGGELQMYLYCPYSPVYIKHGKWQLTDFHIEFGGWKKAACLQNNLIPTKTVIIFQ